MSLQNFLSFDLDRLPWIGAVVLLTSLCPAAFLLAPPEPGWLAPVSLASGKSGLTNLTIDLPLHSEFASISGLDAQRQISFSVDPPRPTSEISSSTRLMVRLNQSKQVLRVEAPSRIDLQFSESGALQFSKEPSLFWLEVRPADNGSFEASLSYRDPANDELKNSDWILEPQETPVQAAEEFPVGHPFRLLGEARWWGQDLFAEKYGSGSGVQRIEVGVAPHTELFDLRADQWLVFRGSQWQRLPSIDEAGEAPIARIQRLSSKGLELEGWGGSAHVRLLLPQTNLPMLKTRGEELFSQLRVRSEKQISCTLDKQCLILRPGDWVLKLDQRWKVLRKKEEKEAFLSGHVIGDIFVLDRIEAKGPVKSIAGHYFTASRAQMVPIDYAATVPRAVHSRNTTSKSNETLLNKSRGRNR